MYKCTIWKSAALEDDNKINSRKFQRFWHFFPPTHNFFFVRHVPTHRILNKKLSCAVGILFLPRTYSRFSKWNFYTFSIYATNTIYIATRHSSTTTIHTLHCSSSRGAALSSRYGETGFACPKLVLLASQIYIREGYSVSKQLCSRTFYRIENVSICFSHSFCMFKA